MPKGSLKNNILMGKGIESPAESTVIPELLCTCPRLYPVKVLSELHAEGETDFPKIVRQSLDK